jgi:hypothetical protein
MDPFSLLGTTKRKLFLLELMDTLDFGTLKISTQVNLMKILTFTLSLKNKFTLKILLKKQLTSTGFRSKKTIGLSKMPMVPSGNTNHRRIKDSLF